MAHEALWDSATWNQLPAYTYVLPIFMALPLPSLLHLGLAAIYMCVKPQPSLYHLCPARPLYPSHSSIVSLVS